MEIVCRPTVISCYREALPNIEQWWAQWKDFMFAKEVQIVTKTGLTASRRVCELLDPIKQSKYPAITEAEQACSISLQIIYLAAFDASLEALDSLTDEYMAFERGSGGSAGSSAGTGGSRTGDAGSGGGNSGRSESLKPSIVLARVVPFSVGATECVADAAVLVFAPLQWRWQPDPRAA